jgi:hypothetical protein
MTTRTPPKFDELPPPVQKALGALREDAPADPVIDAVHERMRARFQAMVARKLALDVGDDAEGEDETAIKVG